MNSSERSRYASSMAHAAACHMGEAEAIELANNLACADPEDHETWTISEAIAHRVKNFGLRCSAMSTCADRIYDAAVRFRRKP